MSYKAFEATIEALKEDYRVNTSELHENSLEGNINTYEWTVKKLILNQEKRYIDHIEALYETRKSDEAFRHYLKYEYEAAKKFFDNEDFDDFDGDIHIMEAKRSGMNIFEKCLEAFDKAYETTKERP